MKLKSLFTFSFVLVVTVMTSCNDQSRKRSLSDKEQVAILSKAYLYGYPLLTMDYTFKVSTKTIAPNGIEKLVWNPDSQKIEFAWINKEVSDPICVPFVAYGNNMFYTIGSRNNQFTFEGIDTLTGEWVFHYIIGGARYKGFYSAPTLDSDGRILYGGLWGVVRLDPK